MKKHTTHFDDCGCQSERYRIAINALNILKTHQDLTCGGCRGFYKTCGILKNAYKRLRDFENSLKSM